MSAEFDAIVCGSGITGGWAAKELTERGLKVLMLERGPNLEHRTDYKTEFTPPWQMPLRGQMESRELATSKRIQKRAFLDEWIKDMFVDDDVDIYESPPESEFQWIDGAALVGVASTTRPVTSNVEALAPAASTDKIATAATPATRRRVMPMMKTPR